MKIAYTTPYNASDIHNWSGLGYFIGKTLEECDHSVDYIGDLDYKNEYFFKGKKLLHRLIGKNYFWDRQVSIAKHFAKQISERLAPETDVIFSPGTLPIALLNTGKPKVFYTDAVFAGMLDYYPAFSNLSSSSITTGNQIEQMALDKCSLALFSSSWAAESALRYYKVNEKKVHVIPFGANIIEERSEKKIDQLVLSRNKEKCILLFMAVEWNRKGGDKAVAVAQALNDMGVETELRLLGLKDLDHKEFPPFVVNYGFISKRSNEGKTLIEKVMRESHFLILPSFSDCTPIVFPEACSFGLPVLTTNTGGIPSIIQNHVNGMTFDINAEAEEYAKFVVQHLNDQTTYHGLCFSAFRTYVEKLNWKVAGRTISTLLNTII